VAVDSSGNVYIANRESNNVLKVTPSGTLSVFAGNGTYGAPTAGPAASSMLASPMGVAVDSSDNVYIVSAFYSAVLKVTPSGTLSTFAGNLAEGRPIEGPIANSPVHSPTGIAFSSVGDIYVASSPYVLKLSTTVVPPTAPQPLKVTPLDQSALIKFSIFSNGGSSITKYQYSIDGGTNWSDADAGTTSPVTVSGLENGTNYSIKLRAVNSAGNSAASSAVTVTPRTGYTLSFFAGTGTPGTPTAGPAISSKLNGPSGVAVDSSGNVYIANTDNHTVLKVTSGGALSVFAGTGTAGTPTAGPATSSKLNGPSGIAVDSSGNVFIADKGNNRVLKVTSGGTLSFFAGNGTSGAPTAGVATSSKLSGPMGVVVDSSGNVYIAQATYATIVKVTSGGTLSTFAGTGTHGEPTAGPATSSRIGEQQQGLAVDSSNNVYIADRNFNVVMKVTPTGTLSIFAGTGTLGVPIEGPATSSGLNTPWGLAVDSAGNVYVTDGGNQVIEKIDANGNLWVIAGTGTQGLSSAGTALLSDLTYPAGLAVDSAGNLYNANYYDSRVEKFTPPPPATVPAAPTSLSATPGNGSASISFTAGANGGASITKYQYTTNDGGSWSDAEAGTSSPVSITGLTNGTTYSIKLRAYNSVGGGAKSSAVSVTPVAPFTTPSAPTSLNATPGDGSVSIAFTAGSDGGAAISKYQYQLGSGSWVDAVGTSSPITVSGLTNGTSYTVKLRAVNVAGDGAASSASGSFTPAAVPLAPTGLVATAGVGSASIAFTPGADGGASITKYQYKVGTGAWTDAVGTTSPITVTGLTNYVTVDIRLRAVNAAGAGASSTFVKVWPRIAGSALGSARAQGSHAIFMAVEALNPVGGTVSHYWFTAYAKGTSTVVSTCRAKAAVRSCVFSGLVASTEYDVSARGFFTLTGSADVLQTLDSATQTVRTKN
jgi:titin